MLSICVRQSTTQLSTLPIVSPQQSKGAWYLGAQQCGSHNSGFGVVWAVPRDLGCTVHTLQLAIKAGFILSEFTKVTDVTKRCVIFATQLCQFAPWRRRNPRCIWNLMKLWNDCAVQWHSTFIMLEWLHEQRMPMQFAPEDETFIKPSVKKVTWATSVTFRTHRTIDCCVIFMVCLSSALWFATRSMPPSLTKDLTWVQKTYSRKSFYHDTIL